MTYTIVILLIKSHFPKQVQNRYEDKQLFYNAVKSIYKMHYTKDKSQFGSSSKDKVLNQFEFV